MTANNVLIRPVNIFTKDSIHSFQKVKLPVVKRTRKAMDTKNEIVAVVIKNTSIAGISDSALFEAIELRMGQRLLDSAIESPSKAMKKIGKCKPIVAALDINLIIGILSP